MYSEDKVDPIDIINYFLWKSFRESKENVWNCKIISFHSGPAIFPGVFKETIIEKGFVENGMVMFGLAI